MADILTVSDIEKRFGGVAALGGCTLALGAGQITGLIGPNGAGKTTLLNVIGGLIRPDRGRVTFGGADVTGAAAPALAGLGLVRTFQIARELGNLTVLENLLLARPRQRGETILGALCARRAVREEEIDAAVEARALLERVGLWRLADQPAATLSGGQKKLLELARALMLHPRLILLDEPSAGVAPPLVAELIAFIRALVADGISFGIVEHDMRLVGSLCDHVHVLAEGRTLISGTFEAVTRDPRVIEAYLGYAA
jgi:ABC-type branched-subunit amino acid transport system ATPase component